MLEKLKAVESKGECSEGEKWEEEIVIMRGGGISLIPHDCE